MIDRFHGDFSFLSNFFPCRVVLFDDVYTSVEHAYQAAKTIDVTERKMIREADTAAKAKKLSHKLKCVRGDWKMSKVNVMRDLLQQKFKDVELRTALNITRPHELVEGNTWGDVWWGVCNGKGLNWLGKILMEIRDCTPAAPTTNVIF